MRALVLFGRDLRLSDHAALAAAARAGDVATAVVLDARADKRNAQNSRRSAHRAAALHALGRDLAARGGSLIVRRGEREAAVLRLARDVEAAVVVWSASYDARAKAADSALQSALEEAGIRATLVHDAPAVAPEETAASRSSEAGRGYRAIGPYLHAWAEQPRAPVATHVRFVAPKVASEALPDAGDAAGVPASEADALAHFRAYVAGPVLQYAVARNVPASDTSRVSACLSLGLISARTMLAEIAERERDAFLLAEERLALAAFARSLGRRDFFLQLAWFFEEKADAALQERMRDFPFATRHAALDAWREGRTGYPLVDAGIRQLHATGWMHPRARSVAASFLCFDLGVDWRIGRDAWDAHLLEDEPALATGNWQWVCGVGADLAQFPRIFNPRKQLRSLDPAGTYVRRWIPELAHVPDVEIFGHADGAQRPQLEFELFGHSEYAQPVVEHDDVARAFLRRYAKYVEKLA